MTPPETSGPVGDTTAPRSYFFLSYAHSAPTSDQVRADTDHWVRVFFHQLSSQVRQLTRSAPGPQPGFFDDLLPLGSDWKTVLTQALGNAEVFVPLYSPGYFSKAWPLHERDMFRQRLARAHAVADAVPVTDRVPGPDWPERHILPVLWIPLPSWHRDPEIGRALALGTGVPEYAENGLRALCMLAGYREQYQRVVRRLAQHIVDIAENHPVGPSSVPTFGSQPPSSLHPRTDSPAGETPLVVAVAAPIATALPPGRLSRAYGRVSEQWRPFPDGQALPAGEYAANVAERLGLVPRVGGLSEARPLFDTCPAVLLLDPWTCAMPNGREELRTMIGNAPSWVTPLVIVDRSDPQYDPVGAALAAELADMLTESGIPKVREVSCLEEFAQVMPTLVTTARRRYLDTAAVSSPKVPGPIPRRPTLSERFEQAGLPRKEER